jgi:nitroreductase
MEKKLPIPIIDTIKKRHSVRTFMDRPLSEEDRRKLTDFFRELYNPFGVDVHIHIVDKELNPNGEKLGTYGVIKDARTFLGVSVPKTENAFLAAGYAFET